MVGEDFGLVEEDVGLVGEELVLGSEAFRAFPWKLPKQALATTGPPQELEFGPEGPIDSSVLKSER